MPRQELEAIFNAHSRFYGKAFITELKPGIQVLESYGVPRALWIEETGLVYLLRGWDEALSTMRHTREFISQKFGCEVRYAQEVRQWAKEGDGIVDCTGLGFVSSLAFETFQHLSDLYESSGCTPPEEACGPRKKRAKIPITTLLAEWKCDAGDSRAREIQEAHLSVSHANELLRDTGYLNEDNSPSEMGTALGLELEYWHKGLSDESRYALYPRARNEEYRSIIYRLFKEEKPKANFDF